MVGQTRSPFLMSAPGTGARLILVCGLPGSGKTTRARALEARLGAVRLAPDEWMDALGFDLYDEAARGRVEALQWELARALLARGLMSSSSGAPGRAPSGTRCGSALGRSAPRWSCITSAHRRTCSSSGFGAGVVSTHPSS
jgi:hypothetical protein